MNGLSSPSTIVLATSDAISDPNATLLSSIMKRTWSAYLLCTLQLLLINASLTCRRHSKVIPCPPGITNAEPFLTVGKDVVEHRCPRKESSGSVALSKVIVSPQMKKLGYSSSLSDCLLLATVAAICWLSTKMVAVRSFNVGHRSSAGILLYMAKRPSSTPVGAVVLLCSTAFSATLLALVSARSASS